jgi:hypothetical protein
VARGQPFCARAPAGEQPSRSRQRDGESSPWRVNREAHLRCREPPLAAPQSGGDLLLAKLASPYSPLPTSAPGGEEITATASPSRPRFLGEVLVYSRPSNQGRGEAGRPMRPIAACAIIVVERTRVSQVTPESPGTPHAMVYGLYRALPGERLFCHRRLARLLARLDTSTAMSGPHDFAVRIKRFRQRRRQRPPRPAPR